MPKDDFIMGTYQKKLWREMNDYAEATGIEERYTPGYVRRTYSEEAAKEIVQKHYLPLMLSDLMQQEGYRKKKTSKSKTKRKKKGCGCD